MKEKFLSGFANRYLQRILIWGLFRIKPSLSNKPPASNKPTPLSGEES